MTLDLSNTNNSSSKIKIKNNHFDFDLFSTPQFAAKYINQRKEDLTALLISQMSKGVSTFINIGAHNGFYDVLVGKSNPNCEIFTFEPVEENVDILLKNLKYYGIEANIIQKAASSDIDIKRFEVSKASDSSGFIANPDFDILKTININTITIDSLISQIAKGSILIKIDAVGGEIAVLEGMKKTIEKFDDIRLIIHFNRKCLQTNGFMPSDLFSKLDALGFQIHLINDENRSFSKINNAEDWENLHDEIVD